MRPVGLQHALRRAHSHPHTLYVRTHAVAAWQQRRIDMFESELARSSVTTHAASSTDTSAPTDAPTRAPVRATDILRTSPLKSSSDDPIVAVRFAGRVYGLKDDLPVHLSPIGGTLSGSDLQFLTSSHPDGRRVFWHSGAHVLGAAIEAVFGPAAMLCDGPAVMDGEGGFFYELNLIPDAVTGRSERVGSDHFQALEAHAAALIKARAPFLRVVVPRHVARDMFRDNVFKLRMLERIPEGEDVTVYRCGDFVDLCRGPHVPHTGVFKTLRVFKSSGSHEGSGEGVVSSDDALLQRVYGIAFPSKQEMTAWEARLQEARKRDHRVIGTAQSLFFFHDASPGCAFLLPHGQRIYNRLVSMLRFEYVRRGYEEVQTPLVYKTALWRTSGHMDAYSENMFAVREGMAAPAGGEEAEYGLKPMNCPGHCLIFSHRRLSYRELPLRIADFSALHRNEASGALGGMTRLRRFAQDDAHIFCSTEQLHAEVQSCLDFIARVYSLFGFTFRLKLSTRPDKYVGELATWNTAEEALRSALATFNSRTGSSTTVMDVDEGGGAFYGPKIDVFVRDALAREHQCATVQLDFQLPRRFDLTYDAGEGRVATPVMIHRAIMGSLERMMAILMEHTSGRWPFWLSPRQVLVAAVADRHNTYALECVRLLQCAGHTSTAPAPLGAADTSVWAEADTSSRTVNKKVREGQVQQFNVIAVVGDAEEREHTVTLRFRDTATRTEFVRICTSNVELVKSVLTPELRAAVAALDQGGDAATVTLPIATFVRIANTWQHTWM